MFGGGRGAIKDNYYLDDGAYLATKLWRGDLTLVWRQLNNGMHALCLGRSQSSANGAIKGNHFQDDLLGQRPSGPRLGPDPDPPAPSPRSP